MKLIKPFTLGLLHRPYPFLGENRFAVAALGFFELGASHARLLPDAAQWPLVMALLPAGMALDEVIPKPRGEALVLGTAYAPGATPVTSMCVRLSVGTIDKCLRVVGERNWGYPARPAPFTSMPLGWDRAYGGPRHPANPQGRGYTGWFGVRSACMPNLELPGQPIHGSWRRLAPAGFGPVDAQWAPRKGKLGTYKARWLASEAPGFASDIDWTAFNVAPQDQWLATHFTGGEAYRLEGMHPTLPVLSGHLPDIVARAFILEHNADAGQAREVPLALDTVWFLPSQKLGIMVFHGEIGCADSDGLDVAAVMVAYEKRGVPKPLAHYHKVLGLRSDPLLAAQHLFDDSQLAPALDEEEATANAAADDATRAAALAAHQRKLDELEAEHWQACGRSPPAGHQPLRAQAPPFEAPTVRALQARDFQLGPMLQQVRALGNAALRDAGAKIADLGNLKTPAPASADEQFSHAMECAIVPAYDLLPHEETGSDPMLAEQIAQLDSMLAAGSIDAPSHRNASAAIRTAPARSRDARRSACTAPAAAKYSADVAARLGEQVRQWRRCGISLAGRDLAGADLRGIDLGGADLRETLFEGADLSGARLAGANLGRAVLVGAQLRQCDLSDANLEQANLSGCDASGATLRRARLGKAQAHDANWSGADLSGARLDDLQAPRLNLRNAILDGVQAARAILIHACADGSRWRGSRLEQAIALRASFIGADFSQSRLVKCSVNEAVFCASQWDGAHWEGLQAAGATDFTGARLRGLRAVDSGMHGAIFAGADLRRTHFLRCDFGDCDLRTARLDDAHFPHCVFMAADLCGASARNADFYRAMLRKAKLGSADLAGARLVQAEMTGAV